MRWRSHLATLAMVLVALLAAHFWQTRNVPAGRRRISARWP